MVLALRGHWREGAITFLIASAGDSHYYNAAASTDTIWSGLRFAQRCTWIWGIHLRIRTWVRRRDIAGEVVLDGPSSCDARCFGTAIARTWLWDLTSLV